MEYQLNTEKLEDIIDPEIPSLPEERRRLLDRCMAVIAAGGRVEGVDPRHVSAEGMHMIKGAMGRRAQSGL
ncbi:MAG TPA: hypothetical protein VFH06_03990 [Candidatus Saccharimonadales bacterium]|nr:hypothetical protein [Candidatus Saccharimonadales bacterium]